MEMPKSIKLFEQLSLSALALGVIQSALFYNAAGITGMAVYSIAIFQLIIMITLGALIFLTSRKKSVICKWILVVFFVIGIVAFIPELAIMLEQGVMGLIGSAQALLQAVATYLLFNSDSKAWFDSGKIRAKI